MTKLIFQWFLTSLAMTGFLSLMLRISNQPESAPETSKPKSERSLHSPIVSKKFIDIATSSSMPPPPHQPSSLASSLDSSDEDELEASYRTMEAGSEAVPRQELASVWENIPFGEVLSDIQSEKKGRIWLAQEVEHWVIANSANGTRAVLESLGRAESDQWLLSGLLVQGLAQAGTPSAREALLSVLSNIEAFPPTVAIQVAMAAAQFGATADATLKDTLLELVDSKITDTMFDLSEVTLSSLARLARDDSAFQESIVQKLLPWLDTTSGPEAAVKALKTFAGAGINRSELLDRALKFSGDDNEDLRIAAENYLASMTARQTIADADLNQ